MRDQLQKALAAIDGVDRSEVELTEEGPVAIRVGLARGADRLAVAEAVQRLLEAHGLRSRVAPDRREPGPDQPPPPPQVPHGPGPAPGPAPRPPEFVLESTGPVPQPPGGSGVEVVTVSETVEGLVVTVVADGGRTALRKVRRSQSALREAIISAIGELVDPDGPTPGLRGLEKSGEYPALTVYLEDRAGNLRVGASLIAAGDPFAFAQAVWAALRG